jgi:hypothetical protein
MGNDSAYRQRAVVVRDLRFQVEYWEFVDDTLNPKRGTSN